MKIWAASCPAKIVLFGEWGVLKGAPAVASTVQTRFKVHISRDPHSPTIQFIDHSPDSTFNSFAFSSSERDVVVPAEWKRLHRDFRFILGQFSSQKLDSGLNNQPGWKLEIQRDWKISEGYGSSSALTLCVCLALKSAFDELFKISDEPKIHADFFQSSPEISKLIELDNGSGIDFAAQWMGGTVRYQNAENERRVSPLQISYPENLVILHTGKKVDTRAAIKSSDFVSPLLKTLNSSVETFIETQDWERAIQQHYEIFKNTPVIPSWISELRGDLIAKNLISALKTTGAGGGDALLILLNQNKKSEFKEWAYKHSFWSGSYPFESQGAALS